MKRNILKGYLFVIISAVIYGCMPLMAKHIYASGANPVTLVFLRNTLALPLLAILAFAEQKTLRISIKNLSKIAYIAFFGCTMTPILLFSSYRFMASGTATIIHFVYPAIVVIFGIVFLKQKVKLLGMISILLCVMGIALFYDPKESISLQGSALALASGVTFAIYITLLSVFRSREISGFLFNFYVALCSSVMTFLICIATNQLALPTTLLGWGLCVLFALSVTGGAVFMFQQGTFVIGGEKAAILSTLEPITSVIIGVLVLNETPTLNTLIGSVLVITASILTAVFDLKKAKTE